MSKTNPLKYAAVADLMEQHELMATAVEAHGVIWAWCAVAWYWMTRAGCPLSTI